MGTVLIILNKPQDSFDFSSLSLSHSESQTLLPWPLSMLLPNSYRPKHLLRSSEVFQGHHPCVPPL